jgi:5-methylthioadenosine/S-adenosylhomocysteine deaminase
MASSSQPAATAVHASWIVAFDGTDHWVLRDGTLVYAGNEILFVGTDYPGPIASNIDATGKLLIPGLISTHAHVGAGYGDRMIVDAGRRDLLRTGFLNHEPTKIDGPSLAGDTDPDAAIRYGFGLLLSHGVTTVVEMGGGLFDGGETMLRRSGESGIRLYYAPAFNPGRYKVNDRGQIQRTVNEAEALAGLDRACDFVAKHSGTYGGRFQGILIPDEAFNSTKRILEHTRRAADELGVGMTLHVGEQVYEFHYALNRTGMTPVRLLDEAGVLRPDTLLGHCRFTGGNSQIAYPLDDDLDRLARSGATVAHAPLAGMRRGGILESFERYRARGVRMSIGTDTFPLDIIAEMQAATILGKIADRNFAAASCADVFRAATLGGAEALGRHDLGRLAPGAKADFVVIDLESLRTGPVFDPIYSLFHAAHGECVDRVVVDGATVVAEGRFLPWSLTECTRLVQSATAKIRQSFPRYHWSGHELETVFPSSFPIWTKDAARGLEH